MDYKKISGPFGDGFLSNEGCCLAKKNKITKTTSKHSRMYGHKWRKVRRGYLKKNPLCVDCKESANEVDHIIPHEGDAKLFWDKSNWQGLCKPCHSRKTIKENRDKGIMKGRQV